MKRGGGRRYYRPDDVDLLKGIRHLLYDEGYTIKGVQKILKEQGVRYVIDCVDGQDSSVSTSDEDLNPDDEYQEPEAQRELEVSSERHSERSAMIMVPHADPHQHAPTAPSFHEEPAAKRSHAIGDPDMHVQSDVRIAPISEKADNIAEFKTNPQRAVALRDQNTARSSKTHSPQSVSVHKVRSTELLYSEHLAYEQDEEIPQPTLRQTQGPVDEQHQPPLDLCEGEPQFLRGEDAAVTVEQGRSKILEEQRNSGLFSRLMGNRGESAGVENAQTGQKALALDDVRRLQLTLFELLECKRILDQARSKE